MVFLQGDAKNGENSEFTPMTFFVYQQFNECNYCYLHPIRQQLVTQTIKSWHVRIGPYRDSGPNPLIGGEETEVQERKWYSGFQTQIPEGLCYSGLGGEAGVVCLGTWAVHTESIGLGSTSDSHQRWQLHLSKPGFPTCK